jgi:hypothetical protein
MVTAIVSRGQLSRPGSQEGFLTRRNTISLNEVVLLFFSKISETEML